MKKVKANILKPDIRIINYDGYKIKIDFNKKICIDGYIPIMASTILEDGKYEIMTGVIDENLNVIVPLRKKIVTKEELESLDIHINISIYKGNKALYELNDKVYLINLNTVKFNKENDDYIPTGYYFKFDHVKDMGNGLIIADIGNRAFLYDVINNRLESMLFNYIKPSNIYKGYYDAFFKKDNENVSPLLIHFLIDRDFLISEEALLNEEAAAIIPPEINKKNELLKYCDDCYNLYCNSFEEENPCKTLQ